MINPKEIKTVFTNSLDIALKIAEQVYTTSLQERVDLINYMNANKEFKFGQVVRIVTHSNMAHMLDCTAEYGIVVGHMTTEGPTHGNKKDEDDYRRRIEERDCYRIYQNKRNPFIGTDAKYIQKIESWDEVPVELREHSMRIYVTTRRYVCHVIKTFI